VGKINFKELFQRNSQLNHEYEIGDYFPESITLLSPNHENPVLLGYISLTCKSCVDMLPTLLTEFKLFPGDVQLYTDGNHDENEELSRHFNPGFPILSLSAIEQKDIHKVFATPFVYRLDSNRMIKNSGVIHSIDDLNRIIYQN